MASDYQYMECNEEPVSSLNVSSDFQRLLERIEDGLAVPFLGAGVSTGARVSRVSRATGFEEFEPTVRWLNRQLVQMLLPVLDTPHGRQRLACSVFVDAWLHCSQRLQREQNQRALCLLVMRYRRLKSLAAKGEAVSSDARKVVDALVDAARNRLDYLAEAAIWSFGEARVCEGLQLEHFASLEPTDAHVYLAYLAREGLITEILTTNYDTCIEKAFERTFHPDERRCGERQLYSVDPAPLRSREENELHVIRGLDEYREKGGRRWYRTLGGEARPVLRLFKLNGCAHAYREDMRLVEYLLDPVRNQRDDAIRMRKRAAERIILTERQLQSFRRERWAQDLFQDRARCQAFVFSGFGSEEPQIRHTALAVMNEWGSKPSKCCWQLPNAPFMAAYDAELSFTQYQMMRGYRDAHRCDQCESTHCVGFDPRRQTERRPSAAPLPSVACHQSRPETLHNCFTGRSGLWFADKDELEGSRQLSSRVTPTGEQPTGNKDDDLGSPRQLPADLFWKRTFQASFLRQVKRACDGPGPFAEWIREHVRDPSFALQRFFRWLSGSEDSSPQALPSEENGTVRPPWRIAFDVLQPEQEAGFASDCVAPLRLSRWLMAIRGSTERWRSAQHSSHPYFPLLEDPLLVLGALFIVHQSGANAEPEASAPVPSPLGLEVPLKAKSNAARPLEIHLVSEEWAESNKLPEGGNLVRQVVVPSLKRLPRESRMVSPGRTIRPGRCIRVAGEEFLKAERDSRGKLLRTFAEAPSETHRAPLRRAVDGSREGANHA